MEYFNRSLSTHNGTALYHSMDRVLEMLEQDTEQNIKSTEYLGSFLITFTDGIDQQSQNIDKDIFVAEDYYKCLKPILKDNNTRKKIYGRNIEPRILSVKGNDITSVRLEEKFDNDLMAICDTYKKMKEIAELQEEFRKISRLLIDRSMQLQCYVPMGFRGRVGWTFSSVKEVPVPVYEPEPVVEKLSKIFLGINAGIGIGTYYESYTYEEYIYDYYDGGYYETYYSEYGYLILPFTVGVDFAYQLTNKFSLGAYTSF